MDPIPASANLSAVLADWDLYEPGKKGYIAPNAPDVGLPLEDDDIKDNFREICVDLCANNAVLSKTVKLAEALPSISVSGEDDDVVSFPLSKRESHYLSSTYGKEVDPDTMVIPPTKFTIHNRKWDKSVLAGTKTILASMRAGNRNAYELNLLGLTIQAPNADGRVSVVRPVSGKEYATILVLLPSLVDSVDFNASQDQEGASSIHTVILRKTLRDSACAIGVYNGISHASLNVKGGSLAYLTYIVSSVSSSIPTVAALSGASSNLRDIFCGWRAGLSHPDYKLEREIFFLFEAEDVDDIKDIRRDEDAVLLANIAPLAKAYGFRLYIGRLVHERLSSGQDILHEYEEYFDSCDDVDPDELSMDSDAEEEYMWSFSELSGASVGIDVREYLQEVADGLEMGYEDDADWVSRGDKVTHINDRKISDREVDIEDDGQYYARVTLKHIRRLSFLIVVG